MTDPEFLKQFLDRTLPFDQWTHRAHLRTAYLLLLESPLPEAIERARDGIQTYNKANHRPESQLEGYHETMTQSWMHLMETALREFGPAESAEAFLEKQHQLTDKRALLFFYSRDHIMSSEAKQRFVEPDLAPLPVSQKPAAWLK